MEEYADEYETVISNDSHRIVSYKEPILGLPIIPKEVKLLSHEKFLQDVVLVTQTGIHDTCEIDCGDPCHQDGCVIRTKQKTRHWTDLFVSNMNQMSKCDFDIDISNNDAYITDSFYALIHRFETGIPYYSPDLKNCGFLTHRVVAERLRKYGVLRVIFDKIFDRSGDTSFGQVVPLVRTKSLHETDVLGLVDVLGRKLTRKTKLK